MRFPTVALLVTMALSTAAIPAFAGDRAHHDGRGTPAQSADGGKKQKASFPMPAAEFRTRVNARLAKVDAHVEKRIVDKKLDAEKAKELRAKVAERKAKVIAATDKACADGTVTADEAKEVRQAGGGHHGGKGAHKGAKGQQPKK